MLRKSPLIPLNFVFLQIIAAVAASACGLKSLNSFPDGFACIYALMVIGDYTGEATLPTPEGGSPEGGEGNSKQCFFVVGFNSSAVKQYTLSCYISGLILDKP